jgi:glycosyltransferase involved in cell wall biosynthesis|tara:strand:- start:233 stop:1435 length:1203 start_codon:yes stop_codon:yes gene_type:complete
MKIVHLVGFFIPQFGGQEYFVPLNQSEMGHEVYIITCDKLYPFPNVENMLKEAGVKDIKKERKPRTFSIGKVKVYMQKSIFGYMDFVLIRDLKKILEKIKPDVVFAHECRHGFPALASLYKKKLKYKLIVDQHDFFHHVPTHGFVKSALRYMEYYFLRKYWVNIALKKADGVIAVTKATKDFLIKTHKIYPNKIKLIPLGVDTDSFYFDKKNSRKIRKKYRIRKDDIVLINSGNIVPRKKLELLIEAFNDIAKNTKNIKLLVVGSGHLGYIKKLKELTKKYNLLDNKIVFTGFVKNNELKNYYSASDIAVWPNNNSISIMEAMACKLPIVMVDLQLSHLVGYDNGLKFSEHNKDKLRDTLIHLIINKNLRLKMANNSLNAIKNNFSYDNIAKKFLELAKK